MQVRNLSQKLLALTLIFISIDHLRIWLKIWKVSNLTKEYEFPEIPKILVAASSKSKFKMFWHLFPYKDVKDVFLFQMFLLNVLSNFHMVEGIKHLQKSILSSKIDELTFFCSSCTWITIIWRNCSISCIFQELLDKKLTNLFLMIKRGKKWPSVKFKILHYIFSNVYVFMTLIFLQFTYYICFLWGFHITYIIMYLGELYCKVTIRVSHD